MKKACITMMALMMFSLTARAYTESESIRTKFSKENRMPALHAFEIGALYQYKEFDETRGSGSLTYVKKESTVSAYARFGLLKNLTLTCNFPYGFIDSETRNDVNGFRDIAVGLELLAYEHTYKYPFVIPYAVVKFPNGDEEDGLGNGEVDLICGTSIGTITFDKYHYILTAQVDSDINGERIFSGAVTLLWDLSDQFAVLAEGKIAEEPKDSDDGVPVYVIGGMSYMPVEDLTINWYGGKAFNIDEDIQVSAKIAYCF